MRIGIDASRANHEQKTGVENYAFHLIQSLKHSSTQQDKIEFVLYTDKTLHGELAELPENWTQKVLKWPPKRLWTQLRLSWEMLFHAPDVLFIPAHVFPIIHPQKTVMMVHDVAALKFSKSYNWFERWYSTWSAKYAAKKLWKVVTPSQFTKDELEKLVISNWKLGDRIFVVKHGYDKRFKMLDEYETNIKQILDKYSLKKPFIMTIGRLEEKKNTRRIVEAFNKIKSQSQFLITNFQLLLIGKQGYGYEAVKHAIDNSSYKNEIITPGWVDEKDLPILMNAAEVFVFPSLYEGFGLPVLEAMACGTPVVTSRGTSLEEVGGEACIYVDPENVEEIVGAIIELLGNGERRTGNVQKGLDRVKDFSWETAAQETLDILIHET